MKAGLKNKLMLCAAVALAAIYMLLPVKAEAASRASKAKKAYKKMMSAQTLNWGDRHYPTKDMKFFCKDMNGDKVPELVVCYDAAFGYEGAERVYTFYKNKVVRVFISDNGQVVTKYYSKRKIFVEEGGRMGLKLKRYCKLSGKKLVVIAQEFIPDSYAVSYFNAKPIYQINSKTVSKTSYQKFVKSRIGNTKARKIKLVSNTEGNRKKYL